MTNEEFEQRMEFILEQQAQFTSDIQQLRETQAQTEQIVNRLAAVTLEGFKDVNAKIDALVDSHVRLTEAQARTDENLRNLIAVVDRYFSNGRNRES
jgi:ABC-type transporter Mla subunit MlaD